jgi:ABC-type glycerol-3-phosphate transport system permease component
MATANARSSRLRQPRRLARMLLFYLVLAVFLTSILLPLYYIFLTAFVSGSRIFSTPLNYFPQGLSLDRFWIIFESLPIGRYMLNTFFLATVSTIIALVVSFLAAYAIARFEFPGANLILLGLLASSMLPPAATLIPLFQMYQRLNLMDTLQGLLLLFVSALLPITVWVLVSFIRQIPREIEDSARVEGAGLLLLLWYIVLPMVRPGMATMFVINFILGWNEFFTPLIFARGPGSKVISMALTEAQSIGSSTQFYQNWGNMAAVAILATIPVFLVTLLFQKQIVEGITSGAMK